jgi:hypothetical protein
MDGSHFDSLTRTLTAPISRRVTLSGLAAGVLLSLGLALDESTVLAKKKKNKKKKDCPKSKPNRCGDKCCKSSEACKKGKCIDHCNDREKNFGETGTDCGGTCRDIRKCQLADECKEDADCFNNVCVKPPVLGFPVCVDCRETVDCGRLGDPLRFACINNLCFECSRDADCPRPGQRPEQDKCVEPVDGGCPAGKPCVCRQCRNSVECPQGQFCDETGTCIGCASAQGQSGQVRAADCLPPDQCANNQKDGDETDVDCGGSCPKCGLGKKCLVNADCRNEVCESGICVVSCTNGIQDGFESDIDCGGGPCPKCAVGKKCTNNANCESGICGVEGVCTPTECGPGGGCCNGVHDGGESDIDCGGSFCPKCQVGQKCKRGSDCETFRCGLDETRSFTVCLPPE